MAPNVFLAGRVANSLCWFSAVNLFYCFFALRCAYGVQFFFWVVLFASWRSLDSVGNSLLSFAGFLFEIFSL